ncbi:interferon-inducible GTPase 5-like, partial [Python bivittatus]|uniref:Interferon-inducible GTPase 5-like n=1 Tax=Python bivittatus TaxID=176946 RepID=A0A9F5N265_PYTBI
LVTEDIHGKKVELSDFDFFIFIAPQSSQATRLQIASEVQQMDKEFYMVQTKIDLDLEEAKKQQLSGYSEEKILLPAKDFCRDSLGNEEVKDLQVFSVSNHKPDHYDFPLLRESLTSDLLWNKKKAFLSNIVTTVSPSVLENKAATLQREIWLPILFAGFIAVIPVPGVAILGGVVLFVAFGVWCYRKFGVDNQSLIKLANFTGKLLSELKSMMTSQSKKTVILHRLPDFLGASMMSVEYFYWERFPIIGCLLSGGISLISSFFMLKKYLSDIKKDTQNILSKAAAAIKKINLAIP